MSAVDIALWDLKGKREKLPLWKMAGLRRRVCRRMAVVWYARSVCRNYTSDWFPHSRLADWRFTVSRSINIPNIRWWSTIIAPWHRTPTALA
ncbi:hypothetical protein ACSKGI_000751 [Salmonella enterica subsp. enterica serovar Kentucky]|nr:hypothetical protein [Salmonella enterica]